MTGRAKSAHEQSASEQHMKRAALLYLASSSPRRRKILEQIGVPFRVHAPCVEEIELATEPKQTVRVNAMAKAQAVRRCFPTSALIAADTVLEFEGRCVGKPVSLDHARDLLALLSGQAHTVLTGVALWAASVDKMPTLDVDVSVVRFRRLSAQDIDAYIHSVNPLDKAGGYDIDQGEKMLIESFEGSRTNVMGLPIEVVTPWLNQQGFL